MSRAERELLAKDPLKTERGMYDDIPTLYCSNFCVKSAREEEEEEEVIRCGDKTEFGT